MNHQTKKRLAAYLLDEIGGIDEAILTEAQSWQALQKTTRSRRPLIRALLIAASLSLVFSVGLMSALVMWLKKAPEAPNTDAPPAVSETPVQAFDSLLGQVAESEQFTLCAEQDINFFDGNVRITLQNRETGECFVSRALTKSEQATLVLELQAEGEAVARDATPMQYRVWVLTGDGNVYTPCLSASAGNMSAAELFAYESERIPTEHFTNLLTALN